MKILAVAACVALSPLARAQAASTPVIAGQAHVAGKVAARFTGLAGGGENSLALVNALRTGTEARLVTVVPPPEGSPAGTEATSVTTTFTPPTRPMGWGNVKHSLALAQDQLARAGITSPTAQQLQAALMGGDLVVTNVDGTTTTTPVRGVLTMRAQGMGWGNVARAGATTLGAVASKVDMSAKGPKVSSRITTAAGPSSAGPTPIQSAKGITTARGSAALGRGVVTGAGASTHVPSHRVQGPSPGAGVVSASAGGGNAAITRGTGNGHSRGPAAAGGNGNGKGRAG
ncbi:MAG TPA: hypothetical protein VEC19_01525 [Usitatibacter sp.]|nr:hypothetical protein [Usitatibacter sp.]